MKTTAIIDRIKAAVPAFGDRVGGTAAFDAASDMDDLPVPHAFVMPLSDEPDFADAAGPITIQDLEEHFAVVVAVANTADGIGTAAGDTIDDLRSALLSALMGWPPAADHGPFEYRGGVHLTMTRARLWHQFDFVSHTVLLED